VLWLAIDISDRVILEQKLFEEKQRTESILKSIGDGVIAIDTHGKIIYINKAALKITGYKKEEVLNKKFSEVFNLQHAINREKYNLPLDKIFKQGILVDYIKNCILIDKNGEEKLIEDSIAPIFDAESKINGAVIVFRDVTFEKKLEEKILKQKHLESIGRLAGGLAHDFNNYLATILGNIDLAKLFNKDEKISKILDNAIKAIEQSKAITTRLLTFSKGGSPVTKVTNLKNPLKETAEIIFAGSQIQTNYKIDENLWNSEVDVNQLNQVFSNIYINAKEALNNKGKVDICAENIKIDELNEFGLPSGNYIKISIKDNGPGIPDTIKDKIFEPFSTTKADGHGLGLSVCYQIIKNHNGIITCNNKLKKGCEFIILLPAVSSEEELSKPAKEDDIAGDYNLKVLFMDDDNMLKETFKQFGDFFNLEVDTVSTGEDALEKYGDKYDLVILDLTNRKGMGGVETAKELLKINRDIYLVVTSGYSDDDAVVNYEKYGFKDFLRKPFNLKELKKVLDNFKLKKSY
jgi:two-component system cell cycle sensor histidine kinase/response regulator CckA